MITVASDRIPLPEQDSTLIYRILQIVSPLILLLPDNVPKPKDLEVFYAPSINVAKKDKAGISRHADEPHYSGPGEFIVVIGLEQPGELVFTDANTGETCAVLIRPGDMYMFTGEIRLTHFHSVKVLAGKRASLTFRFGELPARARAKFITFWQPNYAVDAFRNARQVPLFYGLARDRHLLFSGYIACTHCQFPLVPLENATCPSCLTHIPRWYSFSN
jgi:hypothetical protein